MRRMVYPQGAEPEPLCSTVTALFNACWLGFFTMGQIPHSLNVQLSALAAVLFVSTTPVPLLMQSR